MQCNFSLLVVTNQLPFAISHRDSLITISPKQKSLRKLLPLKQRYQRSSIQLLLRVIIMNVRHVQHSRKKIETHHGLFAHCSSFDSSRHITNTRDTVSSFPWSSLRTSIPSGRTSIIYHRTIIREKDNERILVQFIFFNVSRIRPTLQSNSSTISL